METKNNQQYTSPKDQSPKDTPAPQSPNSEEEQGVRSGANQTDQLDKLQPESESDEAPNKLGNPPDAEVNQGN